MKNSMMLVVAISILLLTSCVPSPEQVPTMAAAIWTPTPVPPTITPSPTSVPYSLTVTVTDEEGVPLAGARITFPGSGKAQPVQTDTQGKFSWNDLPGDSASLTVSVQGYVTGQQTATLQRGPNQVTVALKRDPFGLLPSLACAPGEKLLYIEDFQSGTAAGWSDLENQAGGWSIGEYPAGTGNKVAIAKSTERIHSTLTSLVLPKNVALRLYFKMDGRRTAVFNWRYQDDQSRYLIYFGPTGTQASRQPADRLLGHAKSLKTKTWHFVEISDFRSYKQVWVDGVRLMIFIDPYITEGRIDLVMVAWPGEDPNVIGYFDNIALCELSAPFTSMPAPVRMP